MFFDGITFSTFDYSKEILYSMAHTKEDRKRTKVVKGKKVESNYSILKIDSLDVKIDSVNRLHVSGSPISFFYGNNAVELNQKQYNEVFKAFFDTLGIYSSKCILERSEYFFDFTPISITPKDFVNRCFFLKNKEFKHERTNSANSEFHIVSGQARSFKAYTKNPNKANEKVRFELSAKSSFYGLKKPNADILFEKSFQTKCKKTLLSYCNKILFAEPEIITPPTKKNDYNLLNNGSNKIYWKEKESRLRNFKPKFQMLQREYSSNVFSRSISIIKNS